MTNNIRYNYILDIEKEKEVDNKVEQIVESINEKRSSKNKSKNDDEVIKYDNEYVKKLERSLKLHKKILFNEYQINSKGKSVTTSFIRKTMNDNKIYRNIYLILRNTKYIAYKSYLVKYISNKFDVATSEVYAAINELIMLNVLEVIDVSSIRLTKDIISNIEQIKNFRHSEVPDNIKNHTKLYLNLISIGYTTKESNAIKKQHKYNFSSKRAIIIKDDILLYWNKSYFDANFFIKHSRFKTVYVLTKALADKPQRYFEVKFLEDAIEYDKY